jgi:hypothetical protein
MPVSASKHQFLVHWILNPERLSPLKVLRSRLDRNLEEKFKAFSGGGLELVVVPKDPETGGWP